eukprot:Hpha_TRINITY_DN5031_c0_g1::TRINITY_DN5031_c0_g1_i1::g.94063::m.94063
MELSLVEGGGNGDGGQLLWTNRYDLIPGPAQSAPVAYAFEGERAKFEAGEWGEDGTQVWRLVFTEACTRCRLLWGPPGLAPTVSVAVNVVSPATRLSISHITTTRVVISVEPILFMVVAMDEWGNWDEDFGTADSGVPLSILLEDASGTPLGVPVEFRSFSDPTSLNTSVTRLVSGVAWVACTFLRPEALGRLVVEAGGLSNRLRYPLPPLSSEGGPPEVTIVTVPHTVALLSPIPMQWSLHTPLHLTFAIVDASPPPSGPFISHDTTGNLSIRADGCGAELIPPLPQHTLVGGEVTVGVVFRVESTTPMCAVRASAEFGSLQRTEVVVHVPVVRAVCTTLHLATTPPPGFPLGSPTPLGMECVDSAGLRDGQASGVVYIRGTCGMVAFQGTLTEGFLSFPANFGTPGENCSFTARLDLGPLHPTPPDLVVVGLRVQRPVALWISSPGVQIWAGEAFPVRAWLVDENGHTVRSLPEDIRFAVSLVAPDGNPPRVESPRMKVLSTTHADTQGEWGVWLVFGAPAPPGHALQIRMFVGRHSNVTNDLRCLRRGSTIVRDGVGVNPYQVVGRVFHLRVKATDRTAHHFPEQGDADLEAGDEGSEAVVRVRELDALGLRSRVVQSRLVSAQAGQALTGRMEGGTREWALQWVGSNAKAIIGVFAAPGGTMLPYGPLELTMQAIHGVSLVSPLPGTQCPYGRTDCGACLGCRTLVLREFWVGLEVHDSLNNTVVGDSLSDVVSLWQSNEAYQRVYFTPPEGRVTEGRLSVRVVYDQKSVNTSIGFRASTGVGPDITVWSPSFVVVDELELGIPQDPLFSPVPVPFHAPRLVLLLRPTPALASRQATTPESFGAAVAGGMGGGVRGSQVELLAVCDYNATLAQVPRPLEGYCTYYNTSVRQHRGETLARADAWLHTEFLLLAPNEQDTWQLVDALRRSVIESLAGRVPANESFIDPQEPLTVHAPPGHALPPFESITFAPPGEGLPTPIAAPAASPVEGIPLSAANRAVAAGWALVTCVTLTI